MTIRNGHKHLRSEAQPAMVDLKNVLKEKSVVAVDISGWAVGACKGIDSARQQNRVPPVPMSRAVGAVMSKLICLLLLPGIYVVLILDGRVFPPKLAEHQRRRVGRADAAKELAEARTSGNSTRVDKLLKLLAFPRGDF